MPAYLREKGKNLATKEDLERLVTQLAATTKAVEEVKAAISSDLWLKRRRWNRKWDCYAEIVKNFGEVFTLIREAMVLDPRQPDFARALEDRRNRANAAFLKARQSGSVARIAVAPSVCTVLTTIGDEWNKSAAPEHQGMVARWEWLVITSLETIFSASPGKCPMSSWAM